MKLTKRVSTWLAMTAVALVVLASPAKADTTLNPNFVDIHVSISNQKMITVDTTYYAYGALAVNTASVTATAITVTNPVTTGLVETYTIKGGTAAADGGGVDWVLAASSGTNQYGLKAQFNDDTPSVDELAWASDTLNSTSAVTCSAGTLGDGNIGESGASVSPAAVRKLWFRIATPDVVSDPGHHKILVTLSVL